MESRNCPGSQLLVVHKCLNRGLLLKSTKVTWNFFVSELLMLAVVKSICWTKRIINMNIESISYASSGISTTILFK